MIGGLLDISVSRNCLNKVINHLRLDNVYTFVAQRKKPISYVTTRKDLWRFDMVSAYFLDASQNFPLYKILNRTRDLLGTN